MPTPSGDAPRLTAATAEALRMSDAIIAISADAIISIDESQNIIRFNQGAEDIFRYAADEVLGQPIDLLIPERFRANHGAQVRGFQESPVAARRMGERRQISGLRKGGEEFPAEASISKTRVDDAWIFTVVLRDVSDRLRTEQMQRFLAQAGALLAGSLDPDRTMESVAALAVPVLGDWCIIFLGGDGTPIRRALTVHADPGRAEEMRRLREIPFQMNPEHPVMRALLHGESVMTEIDATLRQAMSDTPEHYAILRSLDARSMIAVPMRARDRTLGALTFFFDSTGRVHGADDLQLAEELGRRAALALDNARLYAEAQSAVHARDDVLAVVSHDLGNPLAAIRLGTTLLLKQLSAPESQAAALQVQNIRASALQMERLIRDLLDIKRIEAGFLSLEREKLAVSDVLADATEVLKPLTEARHQSFRVEAPPLRIFVSADRERILQVFSNLLGNASKFTPEGGEVTIGAHERGGAVEFYVRDTGPGIPSEHIPHIFDRFWQARRTGRHSIGLGLAIVKGIIDAHEGSIRVESELAAGSSFYFTIPAPQP